MQKRDLALKEAQAREWLEVLYLRRVHLEKQIKTAEAKVAKFSKVKVV